MAECMLPSSELMPGGSPTFQRASDIERLDDDLRWLLGRVASPFVVATLSDLAEVVDRAAC